MSEKLKVTRTLGFEIEGYADEEYSELIIANCDVDYDGSLDEGDEDGYGVEVKTQPIKDLNQLQDVYDELINEHAFFVNESCGLHIHIDISDFKATEIAKLMRFGCGIELLMYSLVEKYRATNSYAIKINKPWRKIYRSEETMQVATDDSYESIQQIANRIQSLTGRDTWVGKYQWINPHTPYKTAEFRIFNATIDYKEAQRFGMLAYHIIETVKNSTVEQLEFIIKSLYKSLTAEEMYEKFFDSIGLEPEFRMEVKNISKLEYIDEKYLSKNREKAKVVEQQAV